MAKRIDELYDVAQLALVDTLTSLQNAHEAMKAVAKAGEVGADVIADRIDLLGSAINEVLDYVENMESMEYKMQALHSKRKMEKDVRSNPGKGAVDIANYYVFYDYYSNTYQVEEDYSGKKYHDLRTLSDVSAKIEQDLIEVVDTYLTGVRSNPDDYAPSPPRFTIQKSRTSPSYWAVVDNEKRNMDHLPREIQLFKTKSEAEKELEFIAFSSTIGERK